MKSIKSRRWALAISSLGLLLANSARSVLAQSAQVLSLPQRNASTPALGVDWMSIAVSFREAFRVAVNEWIGQARIQGGTVNGPTAVITPGSLVSDVNIQMRMEEILAGARVPRDIGVAGAGVLAAAWNDWAAGFQMRVPGAYPSLAAVPGPSAPATRAAVSPPLSLGSSAGEASLSTAILASRLSASLRPYATRTAAAPDAAMSSVAAWVDNSFRQWKAAVAVTGLTGKGPVPTYAPPYVPVGPVISGANASISPVFMGPRFGIVVP